MNSKILKATIAALGILVLIASILSIISLVSVIQYKEKTDVDALNKLGWMYDGKALELTSLTSNYVIGIVVPIVLIGAFGYVSFRALGNGGVIPRWPLIVITVITLFIFGIMIYGLASSKSNATDFESINLSKGDWKAEFDFSKLTLNGQSVTQDQFNDLVKTVKVNKPSYDAAAGYATIAAMIITTLVAGFAAYSAKRINN